MRTRDALQQMTGQSYDYGDGPLGLYGRQLLAQFQTKEAQRLADADERAAMAGRGPILDVLRKRLAEAQAAELFNDATPCVTRFEACQALKNARSRNPTDRGLKMAAAHAERLWHKDTMGILTLGDVARLRAHYVTQYPRSVVAQVIDNEIPKIGFNTLPVAKLAQMAAQITGRTDEERQYAYEQVVMAHGLTSQRAEHLRARAFIRELADMAAEAPSMQGPHAGGQYAAQRALTRMAAHDDPILSRVGQMGPPDVAPPPPPGPDIPPAAEEDVPHEEGTEVIEEIESPITGEPMAIELGMTEPELSPEMAGEPPTGGPEEIGPEIMASLQHFGQLDDYAEPDIGMGEPPPEDIDMIDETPDETSVIMEDPTAPGEQVEITMTPVADELEPSVGMGAPAPMPGMDNMASRQASGHVFEVFVVRGGVKHPEPIERVRAAGMPAVIRRIGRKLREAEGASYIQRPVVADQYTFQREAYVVLDPQLGNYLLIRAQEHGSEFDPGIVTEGQPVVQHNLKIDKEDGLDVLLDDSEIGQNVPSPLGEDGEGEHKEGRALTAQQVKKICKKLGLTPAKIETSILDGTEVRVGNVALELNETGDVVLYRGDRGRTASLMDLDRVIGDFMALAAAAALQRRKAARNSNATYRIRPLFTVGCGNCQCLGEYTMPDTPQNVRCASCGWITPLEAVAIQLETRQASAFPGYVITTSIPGPKKNRKLNAKRMLKAIKQVASTNGAKIRHGNLEVIARGVSDAELTRIRRVLEDVFGARDIIAQQAPAVNTMGQPTQHAQMPMPQPQQPAQPMGPGVQPVQPIQPGANMQQATMDQYGNPIDGVPPMQPQAQRLPVGPNLKHVLLQYEDGRQMWQPVEAANEQIARAMIASYMDGTQVLQVVDSYVRQAQLDAAPPPAPAEAAPPAEQMGLEMTGPGGGESIETASLDAQTEETIKAAMLHYRNTGVGIAEATDSFVNNYSKFLDRYGDKTSPARHLIEAAVIRIAKEIYEKPALVQQPPQFGEQMPMAASKRELDAMRQKHNWHVREARRLQALRRRGDEAKGPSPKKINEQQDDWVNLGGGDTVLGPDSETQDGYPEPGSINTQVDTISEQSGSTGAPTDGHTGGEPSSENRDPGDFGAGKGYDADGHVTFDGPGWGQSWPETGGHTGEEPDSQTGDNDTTSSMDGVSDSAYSNVRSK